MSPATQSHNSGINIAHAQSSSNNSNNGTIKRLLQEGRIVSEADLQQDPTYQLLLVIVLAYKTMQYRCSAVQ